MDQSDDVAKVLLAYADLGCFYISVGEGVQAGLIGYVDRSGNAWYLMEDDDSLVNQMLSVLRSVPVPEFESPAAEGQFIERVRQRLREK